MFDPKLILMINSYKINNTHIYYIIVIIYQNNGVGYMMNEKKIIEETKINKHWKGLYKLGAISSILVSLLIVISIIFYFIWPYKGLDSSVLDIFTLLQENTIVGLISLDVIMLITLIIDGLVIIALFAVLKKVNKGFALLGLIIGLIGVIAVIQCRPLIEMVMISEKYFQATTENEKIIYLASGETYRTFFDGTAWMIQTFMFMISGLIYSAIMLKSDEFNNATAIIGISISVLGMFFLIPIVGLVLLFVNTFGAIAWNILIARAFIKLGWKQS